MQLIRSIGIESGYSHTFLRKIYEFVYTKIFFTSLKHYFKEYHHNINLFKEYLLWIYFQKVQTTIGGYIIRPANKALDKNIENWTDEDVFVITIGLNASRIENAIYKYSHIIDTYNLDIKKIRNIYEQITHT